MKKLIIIFAFLLIPCKESWSAFSSGDRGTSAAQFLKLGAGARPAAMGDAFTATTLGSESVYWNPAGLNYESKGSVSMMHGFWFEDIAYDWISGAVRLSPVSVAGLGIQRLSYGDIKGTDISGVETGNFSPSDMAISFSYAHDLGMLMAGGTFKYISSRIDAKATAMAVDAGVVKSWDNIKAGLAVKNAGTKMKFADEKEPLPLAIKFGGSMGLSEKLLACTDLTLQRDNAPTLGLGGEYSVKAGNSTVAARAGYNTITKDIEGFKGFSFGLGWNFNNFAIDYAFVPFGEIGSTHRLSLAFKW